MKIRCHERCQGVHRLECQLNFLPPLTARFDVFVSHEGSDPEVRKLVLYLGNRHLVLGYVAHKKAKSIDGPDSAHVAFGGSRVLTPNLLTARDRRNRRSAQMVVGMRSIEVGELGADVLFNARQSRFDGGEKCHGDLKAESPRIGPTVPIVEIRLLDVG
jgi:hypothetical protein